MYLQYKEGLMIGSACEAGELFQAILRDEPESEIARLVEFYDYLEIQPIGNNMFMVRDENRDNVTSEEDLRDLNRRIVNLVNSLRNLWLPPAMYILLIRRMKFTEES